MGLIGGAAIKRQIDKLREHPQLVVGTPGRVRELIGLRKLKMHEVSTIIIDEADQMFQLSGAYEVAKIVSSAAHAPIGHAVCDHRTGDPGASCTGDEEPG